MTGQLWYAFICSSNFTDFEILMCIGLTMKHSIVGLLMNTYVFWSVSVSVNGGVWSFWEILMTPSCVFCDELGNPICSVSLSHYRFPRGRKKYCAPLLMHLSISVLREAAWTIAYIKNEMYYSVRLLRSSYNILNPNISNETYIDVFSL